MQALRVARPTDRLEAVAAFYRDGLALEVLARFAGHAGYAGVVLGRSDLSWHLELTHADGARHGPAPGLEHLLAVYHDDEHAYGQAVARVTAAGGRPVHHPNPWWDEHGSCWLDPDGYAVALVRAPWRPRAGVYGRFARWYDALYDALHKDYDGEADAVLGLAAAAGVDVTSLLDVACGTGRHLARFRSAVADVVGVDASPQMLAVAAERLPGVPLVAADFRRLDLGRRFAVVTCLFAAVGHVAGAAELDAAVARMAAHVAPGGMLVVEPWLTPDQVVPGGLRQVLAVHRDDVALARTSRSWRDGDVLVVELGWAVATGDATETMQERHRMPLFTRSRYEQALRAAGLTVTWHEGAPWPRAVLVGRPYRGA